MKLQHLAVIFVVIMVPISLVISRYIQTQNDCIVLQSAYTKNLNDATYDALKAFQLNTTNNRYSSLSNSKIRDIEASINTFYNSLGVSMKKYTPSKEELSSYIPAILFNLYDGYYIYSSYENIYPLDANGNVIADSNGKVDSSKFKDGDHNYQDGLKPYIYYSCEYNFRGNRIIINYTLDNYITIYGDLGEGYKTYSGYLINPNDVYDVRSGRGQKKLKYKGIQIEPETLTEHLYVIPSDSSSEGISDDYNYIVYQNKKVYQNHKSGDITNIEELPEGEGKYFWYDDNKKNFLRKLCITRIREIS